jgi:hypothetical protein
MLLERREVRDDSALILIAFKLGLYERVVEVDAALVPELLERCNTRFLWRQR